MPATDKKAAKVPQGGLLALLQLLRALLRAYACVERAEVQVASAALISPVVQTGLVALRPKVAKGELQVDCVNGQLDQ